MMDLEGALASKDSKGYESDEYSSDEEESDEDGFEDRSHECQSHECQSHECQSHECQSHECQSHECQSHEYLIVSWNIDGLKDSVWSHIKKYLDVHRPDIMCFNETKKDVSVIERYFGELEGYEYIINAHSPWRWHGVAMLIRKGISYRQIDCKLECKPRKGTNGDDATCGRLIAVLIEDSFNVVATYCPNSGVNRYEPLKNLDYRVNEWDTALVQFLSGLDRPVVWIGDLNVAPNDIDVSHPSRMRRCAGFTDEERHNINAMLETDDWVDIWRYQHPKEKGYSYRGRSAHSYQWRLDMCIVSESLRKSVTESFIQSDCAAPTDHVPIGIRLEYHPPSEDII